MVYIGFMIVCWLVVVWSLSVRRQLGKTQVSKLSVADTRAHIFRSLLHYKKPASVLVESIAFIGLTLLSYFSAKKLTFWSAATVAVIGFFVGVWVVRKSWFALIDERPIRLLLTITKRLKKPLTIAANKLHEESVLVQKPYDNRDFRQFIKSLDNSDNTISKRYPQLFEKEFALENKTVEDIMIPFEEVKVVDVEDYVGPVLLDELHASRLQIFPVARDGVLIGSVDLADLKEHESKAKIAKYMRRDLNHIDDQITIVELEEAFLEYRTQQFIVVNENGETKGVVSIYQLLQLHS